ncbi:MAG: hypothetical protein KDD48_09095, partial [Bdellovibrionales bacterium]|nr:hypothetical protein [Bdellovibrionales bacterium]
MIDSFQLVGTLIFACAVLHTFLSSFFEKLATKYPDGSIMENLFHLLGEIEVVFGIWAGVYVLFLWSTIGFHDAVSYIDSLDYTEPLFVFVIMTVAATKPIVNTARSLMVFLSKIFPIKNEVSMYLVCLIFGPLMGSFITEPAAMTLTALILRDQYFSSTVSSRFKYLTLATLFVNVSIGGVLTSFAAPPVLMVATKWNWDISFMFWHFGWKAVIAVFANTLIATAVLFKELTNLKAFTLELHPAARKTPVWLSAIHIGFLGFIVMTSHHAAFFMGLFMFFIGITAITTEYQESLKIRQSLL